MRKTTDLPDGSSLIHQFEEMSLDKRQIQRPDRTVPPPCEIGQLADSNRLYTYARRGGRLSV